MEVKRKHMRVTGRVQGVGFRYTASQCAQKLGVTGWVRNDYDGSVEMEAQGTDVQINTLIEMIKNASNYIDIENIEYKTIAVVKDDVGFEIKH